jgi:hypothetical protein
VQSSNNFDGNITAAENTLILALVISRYYTEKKTYEDVSN